MPKTTYKKVGRSVKTSREVSKEKLRGGFYTPPVLVNLCLDRVERLVGDLQALSLLEPSAGDGAFIRGLNEHRLADRVSRITAVELVPEEAGKCDLSARNSRFRAEIITQSMLSYRQTLNSKFDIAVGNPPFVRFQFVVPGDVEASKSVAEDLNISFAGVSNLWIPIFLASLSAIRDGGAFSFVVPAEFLTGISANVARQWLSNNVDQLGIDLFPVGSFPGVMQEVLVVSGVVRRSACATSPRLILEEHGHPSSRRWEHSISRAYRTWTGYLLQPGHLEALEEARSLVEIHQMENLAKFEVATVTGANDFFTVDQEVLARYQLDPWALPLLSRVRHAAGLRFTEEDHSALKTESKKAVLLDFSAARPDPMRSPPAREYLEVGENLGLPGRYKCRIREPWYRVPVVAPGQIMLSKRSHRYPRLILNCCGAYTTDTVYRGRMLSGATIEAGDLVAAFHNSITLLSSEIEGRSFGGGVLELVPSEIARLLVPVSPGFGDEIANLDSLAREGQPGDGEALVDETDRLMVKRIDGLNDRLMSRLQEARAMLLARRMDRNAAIHPVSG